MNSWIESRRNELLELLRHVDILLLNDAEARQLSDEFNLIRAARWIRQQGPRHVVIKKGEHGAYMFSEQAVFFAPAYPLEEVFDPTGAGDSFAGGFLGYLARTGRSDEQALRRAVVYGSTLGSFAVERFSIDRLMEIHRVDIAQRLEDFRRLVAFEEEVDA
jgi:sugar/nucleoside kinase (ribokinase family)